MKFKSLSDLCKHLVVLATPRTGEKKVFYKDESKLTEVIAIDKMGNMYTRNKKVVLNRV